MSDEAKINYWLELAHYDLATAKAMLKTKRYLYVGFMCHQTVEKLLKAYYSSQHSDTPPYTHNLSILAQRSGLSSMMNDAQQDLLDMLNPLNIEARYPTYKEKVLKELTQKVCTRLVRQTGEFTKWIKKKF